MIIILFAISLDFCYNTRKRRKGFVIIQESGEGK